MSTAHGEVGHLEVTVVTADGERLLAAGNDSVALARGYRGNSAIGACGRYGYALAVELVVGGRLETGNTEVVLERTLDLNQLAEILGVVDEVESLTGLTAVGELYGHTLGVVGDVGRSGKKQIGCIGVGCAKLSVGLNRLGGYGADEVALHPACARNTGLYL